MKDIASKVEEIKSRKTRIDPRKIGIGDYEPPKVDIDTFVKEFADAWETGEDAVLRAGKALHKAVQEFGEKEAFKVFDARFHLGQYNLGLLSDIGSGAVDARVWTLPRYMHGIRSMNTLAQVALLNTHEISIYKFASEKPKTIDLGSVNQSDWRVAFDREKAVLRSSEEQLRYIHGKKREFKTRINWKISNGKVVFKNACTLTKDQLKEILKSL